MGKSIEFDEEGLPIPQKVKVPTPSVKFDDEGLPVPIKKKEQSVPSNFGSLAGKYGYASEEKQQKPVDPTEFAKEYNRNFEQFTGHKELELGSSLPQIAKQREQRKYLKNRAIEETEFKPLLNNVQTGTTSPQQLASLYKKPYGKKIVQDVVEEVMPGASQYGLDPEVFGNEEKWNTIAQNINVKNRPQGVEAQNQYYYNLDNEIYNDLDQLELGNVSVSGGTGGGAANVSSFKLSGVNTNSPEEIGAAISQIESADFVKGKDGQKVEKEPLLKKLNEKLFYLSSQKEIHPDIYALSDKAKEAITRVNMQRERGESISPGEFAKNDQLNQEHFQLGLNFIKDAKPGMYANVSRGLNERGVVSDLDFEQIAGIGQEIYNQKIFREGAVNPEAIGKESKLDYQTYQSKKANYAAILSEEINRLGYKNRAKAPQSAIDKAVARHPELTNVEIINDIRKDEANGGYGVTKGGLLNSFFRGMASPIKGINQTYNALTESPVDNYLNSRRLDYGDQLIADKKGNFRDVLPSERGNIFNEISEGFGQFITQVGLSKGMGKIIQAPYSAAAGSVPRAAMTGAQASNIAAYPGTFLTTAIQTYGSAYTDLLNKTGDPNTAKLGATVNTVGQSAIEAFIMPDVKIADKAKGLLADARAKFADDIVSLVKKGEGKDAAKSVVRNFAENSAKIMGGNITEENLQQLTDYTTEALFSPSTIKDRNLGNELWETTKGTVLQMAIPTLLGAGGQSKQQQKFGKDALNTGAINFDEYKDALGKSLINGEIDQQKHDEAIQILGLHKESINNAPKRDAKGELVSEERQLEYAYQNTVAEVNAQLAANQKDPVQREPFEKKIQEADAVKRKIYYGEEIKGLPKEEEEVAPEVADDDAILEKIKTNESVTENEQQEDLQYFIDKVGEAPASAQRFGEGIVEQLLPRVPTAKLEENYKFLAEIDPEGQDADAIAKELDRRANEANPPIDQQRELDMGDEIIEYKGERYVKKEGTLQKENGELVSLDMYEEIKREGKPIEKPSVSSNVDTKSAKRNYSLPVSEKARAAIDEAMAREDEIKEAGWEFELHGENPSPREGVVAVGNATLNLENQNKGLGTLGYILEGEKYLKQGKRLISEPVDVSDPDYRSAQATKVWKKLVDLGLAEETSPGNYMYGGEREGAAEKGSGKYKFPLPSKPVTEMNYEELNAHAKEVRRYEKRIKMTDEEVEKLSKEDQDDYYGRNLDPAGVYDAVEIDRIANRVGGIEEAETAKEISEWIKRPLIDYARKKDTENLAVIAAAKRRADELGIDANDLIKESFKRVAGEIKDESLVQKVFESISQPEPQKQLNESTQEATKTSQSIKEELDAQKEMGIKNAMRPVLFPIAGREDISKISSEDALDRAKGLREEWNKLKQIIDCIWKMK